jgi:hypothetical protein
LYPFYNLVPPEERELWLEKIFYFLKNKNFINDADEDITKFIKKFQTDKDLFRTTVENILSKHSAKKSENNSLFPEPTNLANKTDNPVIKAVAYILLAAKSIMVEVLLRCCVWAGKNIIRLALGVNKAPKTTNEARIPNLEQETGGLEQKVIGAKAEGKCPNKNKEDIEKGSAGTMGIPIEALPAIGTLPSSTEETGNTVSKQNHKNRGIKEGNSDVPDIVEGNPKDNLLKHSGAQRWTNKEAAEIGDPPVIQGNKAQPNPKAQDPRGKETDSGAPNEQPNGNNDLPPDMEMFNEVTLSSRKHEEKPREEAGKNSASPNDAKRSNSRDLDGATDDVERTFKQKTTRNFP